MVMYYFYLFNSTATVYHNKYYVFSYTHEHTILKNVICNPQKKSILYVNAMRKKSFHYVFLIISSTITSQQLE